MPLLPLSALFALASGLRRLAYRHKLLKSWRCSVPLLVVGNITVGGTGKTPLIIWLAHHLRDHGWRPGIVLRGYGGKIRQWPCEVHADSDPSQVGDEAVLLARRSGVPVVAGPDRAAAAKLLVQNHDCRLLLSDDGLQHYALERDIEIAVIDGSRGLGNGFLLPAGPLREGPWRLRTVDLVVSNGFWKAGIPCLHAKLGAASNLSEPVTRSLDEFVGQLVHAVAGIGHPQRFFYLLSRAGLQLIEHIYPDHHAFSAGELDFDDSLPVLMTEKDAVKYAPFATGRHWAVALELEPETAFVERLEQLLQELRDGQETAGHSGLPDLQGQADS